MELMSLIEKKKSQEKISEQKLCKLLEINPSRFNKWKQGKLEAPHPQKFFDFYKNLESFLDIPVNQVIGMAIFPKGAPSPSLEIKPHSIPPELVKKLRLIGENLYGCEELADVIIDVIKSYKKHLK